MFEIERAPEFGQQNPWIYEAAFGDERILSIGQISDGIKRFLDRYVPDYSKNCNPQVALNPDSGDGNCEVRTAICHTLAAPFSHIISCIAVKKGCDEATPHLLNGLADVRGQSIRIIDNDYFYSQLSEGKEGVVTEVIDTELVDCDNERVLYEEMVASLAARRERSLLPRTKRYFEMVDRLDFGGELEYEYVPLEDGVPRPALSFALIVLHHEEANMLVDRLSTTSTV